MIAGLDGIRSILQDNKIPLLRLSRGEFSWRVGFTSFPVKIVEVNRGLAAQLPISVNAVKPLRISVNKITSKSALQALHHVLSVREAKMVNLLQRGYSAHAEQTLKFLIHNVPMAGITEHIICRRDGK